jgi:soluble lytic murein transglycosylase-like protein
MNFVFKSSLAAALAVVMFFGAERSAEAAKPSCVIKQNCVVTTNIKGLKGAKLVSPKVARVSARKSTKVARRDVALPAARQQVVNLIKKMAPSYGVPTWFALRIAKVESSYNPRARGLAGEYGVFQMKCATARLIGYRGNCRGLLNAQTNVQYGLKHLQLAVKKSRGNLKLAASKHNGGLGRKSLVRAYVRRVF